MKKTREYYGEYKKKDLIEFLLLRDQEIKYLTDDIDKLNLINESHFL